MRPLRASSRRRGFSGWHRQAKLGDGLLRGEGDNRGFFHAGSNLGYFARFGASVSNGRGWVIMANAQKDRFGPILQAIGKEFDWIPPGKGA